MAYTHSIKKKTDNRHIIEHKQAIDKVLMYSVRSLQNYKHKKSKDKSIYTFNQYIT